MKRDHKELSPRTFFLKQDDWVEASKDEVKIWKEGRRDRYEQYRLAWINSQPHAFVESTEWEFATQSGLILRVDAADTISRMTDFVCVISGIKEVIMPPYYPRLYLLIKSLWKKCQTMSEIFWWPLLKT